MCDNIESNLFATLAGAVCGGTLTLLVTIVTFILKRIGKLVIFNNKSNIEYKKQESGFGQYIKSDDFSEADRIEISIDLNIYNQTEVPKTLGDFSIEIHISGNRKRFPVKEIHWNTSNSEAAYTPVSFSREVPVITISPKETNQIICKSFIEKEEISGAIDKVFLIAQFPNGKNFKERII